MLLLLANWGCAGALAMCFSRTVVLLLAVFLSPGVPLARGKRVALAIGNSENKHTPRLENSKNDASDTAATLKKLGFSVIEGRDLDKTGTAERSSIDAAERTDILKSVADQNTKMAALMLEHWKTGADFLKAKTIEASNSGVQKTQAPAPDTSIKSNRAKGARQDNPQPRARQSLGGQGCRNRIDRACG